MKNYVQPIALSLTAILLAYAIIKVYEHYESKQKIKSSVSAAASANSDRASKVEEEAELAAG